MDNCVVFDFYNHFIKDDIVLLYSGDFNDYVLINSTEIIKNYISDEISFEKNKNKMIFLMIESFQNVIRYAEIESIENSELEEKMFVTRKIGDELYVATANVIEKEKKDSIEKKITKINKLDSIQLKQLFIEVLTNRQFTEKGGAGLGFIEMSRKSKTNLFYDFDKISDDLFHFYFMTKLNTKEESASLGKMNIKDTKAIHKLVSEKKIMLLLKNDFSEDVTIPALMMVEENLKSTDKTKQKIAFHVIVELMQNLSKHAALIDNKRKAIIVISKNKIGLEVCTGNIIDNKNITKLKKILSEIKDLSNDELSSQYIAKLVDYKSDDIGGVGFIDIARESEDFSFDFMDINDKYTFFVFTIIIKI